MSYSLHYLPYKITGNLSSPYLLIFLHGWPDTLELWDPIISQLSADFLCANISYPNYSKKTDAKWGYDFPQMIDALKNTIDKIDLTSNSSQTVVLKEKIVVAHDWGCYYNYYFDQQYPGYLKGMVTLDIAPNFNITRQIISYQLRLTLAFLIGGKFGRYLNAKFLNKVGYISPWQNDITPSWNYPYYYLWRNLFRARFGMEKLHLQGYKPSCPVSYIYAMDKPFQFQNTKWFKWLERNEGCSALGVKGGHWFLEKQKDLIVEKVRDRVKSLRAKL